MKAARISKYLAHTGWALGTVVFCLAGWKLIRQPGSTTWQGIALVSAVYLLVMWRWREKRPQLALSLWSLIMALYAAELVLMRTITWPPIPSDAVDFDRRRPIEVLQQMRAEGTEVYFLYLISDRGSLLGRNSGVFPLAGISNTKVLLGNESGKYAVHDTDEFGFSNAPGWSKLPPGQNIAVIGDSYVQGWSVPMEETIVARMNARREEDYPTAISIGIGGSGPLGYLAMLVEYLRESKPAVVYWCFYEGNDLLNLKGELRTMLKNYLVDPGFSQGLRHRQDEMDEILKNAERTVSPPSTISTLWHRVRLKRLRETIAVATRPKLPIDYPHADFSRILARAKEEVESWGGKLVFVYLPAFDRWASRPRLDLEAVRPRVLSAVKAHDLDLIDLPDLFENTGDPVGLFPYRQWGHYNTEGYDLVAEALFRHAQEVLK